MLLIFDRNTWSEVLHTIKSNRKRTITTAMGIFWGLFLLVVLLSLGQGFKNSQANFFSSLSTNGDMAIIAPGVTTVPYKETFEK